MSGSSELTHRARTCLPVRAQPGPVTPEAFSSSATWAQAFLPSRATARFTSSSSSTLHSWRPPAALLSGFDARPLRRVDMLTVSLMGVREGVMRRAATIG